MIGPFLICGGLAAAVNWIARIILSPFTGFETAVVLAYVIGMTSGFLLYRRFVWPDSGRSARDQVVPFIAVNAVSAVLVLILSVAFVALGEWAIGRSAAVEAIAHGMAIGIGAFANFAGHSRFTFLRG